jgi:hypothetical protein
MRICLLRQRGIGNKLLCDLYGKRYYCYHGYSFCHQLRLLQQVPDHLRAMHLLRYSRNGSYYRYRKYECYVVVLIH